VACAGEAGEWNEELVSKARHFRGTDFMPGTGNTQLKLMEDRTCFSSSDGICVN
jgi:hypothetical protein